MRGLHDFTDGMARWAGVLRQAVYGLVCWKTRWEDRRHQGADETQASKEGLPLHVHFAFEWTGGAGLAGNDCGRIVATTYFERRTKAIPALLHEE